MTKWITFADSFPVDSKACFEVLKQLNDELVQKSVLLGNGLKPSEADVIVFPILHPSVVSILAFHDKLSIFRIIPFFQECHHFFSSYNVYNISFPVFMLRTLFRWLMILLHVVF